jgi:hypothetical protein
VLKANLKVGEEYAVGASSKSWDLRRVELVEIDGERVVGEGDRARRKQGFVVRFPDGGYWRGPNSPGGERVLDSARDFISPWAKYAPLKAKHDRVQAQARKERQRRAAVGQETETRLYDLGIKNGYDRVPQSGDFFVSAETMAQIVAMIPLNT